MPSHALLHSERAELSSGSIVTPTGQYPLERIDAVILQMSDLSIAPDPVRLMLVLGKDTLIIPSAHPDYDVLFAGLEMSLPLDREAFLRAMDCPISCDFTLYERGEK